MTVYLDCPKCDNEFEFQFDIAADRSIETLDEIQRCACPFTETELDQVRSSAMDKLNEL